MKEKFRFKINYDEINEDNIVTVGRLKDEGHDGAICIKHDNFCRYRFHEVHGIPSPTIWNLEFIPESWFTKIEEPMKKEEAWAELLKQNVVKHSDPGKELLFYMGWERCIENQKLMRRNK